MFDMKFTCTKENIRHVMGLTSALTGRQTHLPILSHVLIEARESKVDVVATNLEVAVRATVRAKVETIGTFTVPAKTFADYIGLLSEEQVDIWLDGQELVVESGSSRTRIKGMAAEEFPVMPEIDEQHVYTIDAGKLRDGLTETVTAAAKNEIRPELSGVYAGFFTDRYKGLVLAATDSYRLAETQIPVLQGKDTLSVIIPARTVYEMVRLIGLAKDDAGEEPVRLFVSDNQIAMRYNAFEMTSRLIDGKYPDYVQIVPTKFKTSAAIPTDVLANKIKAAALFTTTGVNAVSFDLNAAEHTVAVSSANTQTGQHESNIDVEVTGEENSILLNHRYVLDGLQHMGDTVLFDMNGPDSPCVFRPKEDEKYLYIVMPIRQ